MKRIYLSADGIVRQPTAAENSHYGIARTELGPLWAGDADDAYGEMWQRGWLRVVDFGDKVYAEKYLSGSPVPLTGLPRAQREWLEDVVISGKQLFWNDRLFSLTAENKLGQAQAVVAQRWTASPRASASAVVKA
jgi:hypothetical protein